MRKVTKYYKRIRAGFLQAAIFIMFIYVFFIPNVTGYVSQGDNYFTVFLNGTQIGYMGETDAIDDIVREARAKVALQSEEMVYAGADVEVIAEEVYFGRIDTYRTLVERAAAVLEDSIIETLGHAYTLKMNEYSVNLADSEEVITLLEASLSEYDTENAYQVNLVLDPTRELNALTAEVVNAREQEAQEELPTFPQAGTEQYFSDLFAAIEPAGEKEFDDFEYGLTMMDFSEEVEVVEAFLMDSELTPLEQAVNEVTKDKEVNVVYEVVAGDTLSGISEKTDIPVERIIELNDTLEDETSTIRIGDELIVTVPEPELSVERTELVYLEEDYDAEVIYIENDEWYTTDEVVRQEPSAGHRNVAALISYHNDKEVSREIVKEEV
ncbi:MAG: G5 domain-containing protein, partial [Lachnospiraceae bacterium]|nr:G5 domain-containing protein [Lachnospiraceae bacterium]